MSSSSPLFALLLRRSVTHAIGETIRTQLATASAAGGDEDALVRMTVNVGASSSNTKVVPCNRCTSCTLLQPVGYVLTAANCYAAALSQYGSVAGLEANGRNNLAIGKESRLQNFDVPSIPPGCSVRGGVPSGNINYYRPIWNSNTVGAPDARYYPVDGKVTLSFGAYTTTTVTVSGSSSWSQIPEVTCMGRSKVSNSWCDLHIELSRMATPTTKLSDDWYRCHVISSTELVPYIDRV